MRLHKTSRFGDYEIYPIYEIDYDSLSSLSGFTVQQTNDNVQGYKYRRIFCANNSVGGAIQLNIPRNDEQDGNIIPFTHKYNNQRLDTRYYLPENVMESFEYVPIGEQPDDWGSNPNYVEFSYPSNTYDGHLVSYPACIRLGESFSRSTQYYKDTKRTQLRMFYTDSGNHFTVSKGAYYNYNRPCGTTVILGGFPSYYFGSSSQAIYYKPYYFGTDSDMLSSDYYSFDNWGITNIPSNADYLWSMWNVGVNVVTVFIHCIINGVDFYGTAAIQFSSWDTETNEPVAIRAILLDSSFWGTSIIPGGGGSGSWGSKTTTGGGDGIWTFSSNNRGDRTGDGLETEVTARRTALQAFFNVSNGFQLHQLLSDDLQHIFALLYDDTFISRYTTAIYNPLSAVLSLHLLPQRLVDPQETTSPLTLSGYNISSNLPTPKNFPIVSTLKAEHIGDVDIDATDTFLDYAPYTRAYLHLPYIGVVDIDINAIAAGTISVDYITDATTGNCAAFVWCSDRDGVNTYKYVATGNCAYTMPMFAAQQDGAAIGKIVNSTLGLAMSAISGNAAGAISAAGGIAGGIFDAATTQRNTQITGSFSGNASLISDTVCWLEIVRPVWAEPEHFQQLDGLPSMLSGTIADFSDYGDAYSGYLRVVDLDTDGIHATDDELTEIESVLKSGIFVNEKNTQPG